MAVPSIRFEPDEDCFMQQLAKGKYCRLENLLGVRPGLQERPVAITMTISHSLDHTNDQRHQNYLFHIFHIFHSLFLVTTRDSSRIMIRKSAFTLHTYHRRSIPSQEILFA